MDPYYFLNFSIETVSGKEIDYSEISEYLSVFPNGDWEIGFQEDKQIIYKNEKYKFVRFDNENLIISFVDMNNNTTKFKLSIDKIDN